MSEVVNAKVMNDLFNFEPIREQILVPIAPADNVEGRPGLNEEHSTDKSKATRSGLHEYAPLNDVLSFARTKPKPVHLYDELVIEGEVTVMFAPPNVGKTAFAIHIAEEIAQDRPVLYFNYELSDLQMLDRYTDKTTNEVHTFPNNFKWIWRSDKSYYGKKFTAESVMKDIRECSEDTGGKIVFIDNMGALCLNAVDPELAGNLMLAFQSLKSEGFTVIVITHPVKGKAKSYELHDIYGSGMIGRYCDAAFVMGEHYMDNSKKFVKQCKARGGRKDYLENNVLCYDFDVDAMRFVLTGNGVEWDYLAKGDEYAERSEKAKKREQAISMKQNGKTIDQIASELGVARSTIGNWVNGIK